MEWGRDGYTCGHFRDAPGQVWPDFVHKTDEVVTVLKGRLELEMDGDVITVEEGDEVFIPRGMRHTVRNVHRRETRWLYGYKKRLR